MVRRVALITTLTAVLSPVTGVLLPWLGGPVLFGIQRQSAGVPEQLDLLSTFTVYALFYTGPPALLFAVFGATVAVLVQRLGVTASQLQPLLDRLAEQRVIFAGLTPGTYGVRDNARAASAVLDDRP